MPWSRRFVSSFIVVTVYSKCNNWSDSGAQEETVATNLTQNFNTFINSIFLLLLYNIKGCTFWPEIRTYDIIVYIITYILKLKVEVEV